MELYRSMARRLFTAILPTLLLLEAALSGLWIWSLVPGLTGRGVLTLAIVAARAIVSVAQIASSWCLRVHRPFAASLARPTLLAAGVLMTLEVGFRLAPTNVDPSFTWPIVGGYWAYVALAILALTSRRPRSDESD
jgi:hypothetical protein